MPPTKKSDRCLGFCTAVALGPLTTGLILLVSACSAPSGSAPPGLAPSDERQRAPYRLGLLFDQTGPLADFGQAGRAGVELAAAHVAAAGGVFGQPVEFFLAEAGVDPTKTVAEANRLVSDLGVHALIGPFGSAAALAVARQVSGPRELPTISPTATAPEISQVDDGGYFFRSTVSDAAQAPILARLARAEGYDHVAVLFSDDAYGRGLFGAFSASFDGGVTARAIEPGRPSYADDLHAVAGDGAQVLIAISYEPTASVYLPEAKALGLFDHFLLVDGTLSQDFVDSVGAEFLEGVKGTSAISDVIVTEPTESQAIDFTAMFQAAYGRTPSKGIEANAYDIAICLCLAAEHAGSTEGAAIRESIYEVCGEGGEIFGIGADSVAAAFDAVRRGKPVDFDGAASQLAFDQAGDLAAGEIGIWQYRSGELFEIGRETFLSAGAAGTDDPSIGQGSP